MEVSLDFDFDFAATSTIQTPSFPMALALAPRLRIVHLSDTHQYDIDAVARIPDDTDLIIHTGDFTNRGR